MATGTDRFPASQVEVFEKVEYTLNSNANNAGAGQRYSYANQSANAVGTWVNDGAGLVTIPTTGWYLITAKVQGGSGGANAHLFLGIDGPGEDKRLHMSPQGSTQNNRGGSAMMYLTAGQTVEVVSFGNFSGFDQGVSQSFLQLQRLR